MALESHPTGHTVAMVDVSPREAEVLALVGEQLTNPEIAARLYISVRTVESHVSSLLRKLGVDDRRGLVALARAAPVPVDQGPTSGERLTGGLQGAPEAFTSFIGRDADVRAVLGTLEGSRLVTLTGPGGIGKTRLAIEVGNRTAAPAPGSSTWCRPAPTRSSRPSRRPSACPIARTSP